jgi:hypothetical protein
MSLLINDDLIWISVPKCASVSIERALINSELDIKLQSEYKYMFERKGMHSHIKKSQLFNEFGIHPTVCITRNWLDRWLSALEFVWQHMTTDKHAPIIPWEEIDNKFIIKTFDTKFKNELNNADLWESIFKKLLKYPDVEINTEYITTILCVFMSQNHWKENQPCTYEFDIKELDKFEEFIQKRYGVSFKIPHLNSTPKIKNKIEINDELKNHLWNVFEKPFEKRNSLI